MTGGKETTDLLAFGVSIGVLAEIIPIFVGLAALIWYGIRFYEWFRFRIINRKKNKDEKFL